MTSPSEPKYVQVRLRRPTSAWPFVRLLSVGGAAALCVVLLERPAIGLFVFWRLIVPVLPLLFLVAPGLWRNVCPMAAANQVPRALRLTRALPLPRWLERHGYAIGLVVFFGVISSRPVLFDHDARALAALVAAAISVPLLSGLFFKGKSGFCGSICPLRPIQGLYGQTPLARVENSHCRPCVGGPGHRHRAQRRLGAAHPAQGGARGGRRGARSRAARWRRPRSRPGGGGRPRTDAVDGGALDPEAAPLAAPGSAAVPEPERPGGAPAPAPSPAAVPAAASPDPGTGPASRPAAPLPSLPAEPRPARVPAEAPAVPLPVAAAGPPPDSAVAQRPVAGDPPVPVPDRRSGERRMRLFHVTVMPEGDRLEARPGATLLDVAKGGGVAIEPGCRMGLCGCDPIYVYQGMDSLSPAGEDERATLERLGLPEHARMACCARILGDVVVSLEPTLRLAEAPAEATADRDRDGEDRIERVVIVGNGIAGVTAADHIRRHRGDCEIHLITEERHPFYNRTSVSRLIHARSGMQGMYLLPQNWYDERRITCWLNTRVAGIDREARRVRLGTGEELDYDRLVLATGSSATVPPIEGYGLEGSFTLREADDAMRIRAFAQGSDCRRAVVAGGGVLGLEAADALQKLGLEVTVVERGERLAPAQLAGRGAELLRGHLEDRGIEVLLSRSIASVRGEDRVSAMVLEDGTRRDTDLLLVCAGISANVDLARAAGLEVNRGVVVDDEMRTSDAAIFAAGDVAEHGGRVYGLWPAAVEQAEVAAANIVGDEREYRGSVATHLKVAGVDLTAIGRTYLGPEATPRSCWRTRRSGACAGS